MYHVIDRISSMYYVKITNEQIPLFKLVHRFVFSTRFVFRLRQRVHSFYNLTEAIQTSLHNSQRWTG